MMFYRLLSVNLRLFDGDGGGAGAAGAAGSEGIGSGTAATPEHTPQGVRTGAGRAGRNNAAGEGGAGGTRVLYGKQPQGTGAPDAGGNTSADSVPFGSKPANGNGTAGSGGNGNAARESGNAADEGAGLPAGTDADKSEKKARTPEERRTEFRRLIEGEFREEFGAETRRLIDKRFREGKENAEQAEKTRNLLALLGQRYGVDPQNVDAITKAAEDDAAYWAAEAEKEGLSTEQVKRVRKAERENAMMRERLRQAESRENVRRQAQALREEGDALKQKYPDFDLRKEVENPQFFELLRNGVPMETAYQALHMDAMMTAARNSAAAEAERRVTENVRARGGRPREAGAGQPGAFTVKSDVTKLTREDMEEVKRRVRAGERISF